MYGAGAVQKSILEAFRKADISVSIVWIPIYGVGDTQEAAGRIAQTLHDPRVRHFFDSQQLAGKAVASGLGAKSEADVAWDIYLFYKAASEWGAQGERGERGVHDRLPQPVEWMHQLADCNWADQARLRCGADLNAQLHAQLHETMQTLMQAS